MIFFKKHRIERLKRRIFILEAEIAATRAFEHLVQKGSMFLRLDQTRELAELQYDLRKLQEAS